jgi:hypothetical protein
VDLTILVRLLIHPIHLIRVLQRYFNIVKRSLLLEEKRGVFSMLFNELMIKQVFYTQSLSRNNRQAGF